MNAKAAYTLAAAPILICAILTALWGYDGPYWDSWYKIPLIVDTIENGFSIANCWTLVNEHRIFFPNLLTIPIATWTHWTLGFELALSITFAIITFLIIARVISKELPPQHHWLIPLTSLLMFSYSQHNIWMWGLHIAIPMTLLGMILTILALTRVTLTGKHLSLAIIAAIFACYSFGAGVAVWGGGAVLLTIRRHWPFLAVWVIAAAIAMTIYFIGYQSTPANTSALDALKHPLQFSLYVLAYLGGPLASWNGIASSLLGTLGMFGICGLILRQKQNINPAHPTVPFAYGLILIGLGCALLTALKGWPEGINQAVSSRYLAWPTLFWIGFLLLLLPITSKRTRATALLAVAILTTISSLHGAYKANERHDAYTLGRTAYIANQNETDWIYLYPTIDIPRNMRDDLVKHQLAFFRTFQDNENPTEKPVE